MPGQLMSTRGGHNSSDKNLNKHQVKSTPQHVSFIMAYESPERSEDQGYQHHTRTETNFWYQESKPIFGIGIQNQYQVLVLVLSFQLTLNSL